MNQYAYAMALEKIPIVAGTTYMHLLYASLVCPFATGTRDG